MYVRTMYDKFRNAFLFQGELLRTDLHSSDEMVKFTSKPFILPHPGDIRLVDDDDNYDVSINNFF